MSEENSNQVCPNNHHHNDLSNQSQPQENNNDQINPIQVQVHHHHHHEHNHSQDNNQVENKGHSHEHGHDHGHNHSQGGHNPDYEKKFQKMVKQMYDGPYTKVLMNPSISVNYTILQMIKLDQCQKVLEAGAGAGIVFPFLIQQKPQSCEYFATEFSRDMLSIYQKNISLFQQKQNKIEIEEPQKQDELEFQKDAFYEQYNLHLIQQDATDFSRFQDNTFDAYLSNLVLHHINDQQKALNEAFRVLKKGGRIIYTCFGQKELNFFQIVPQVINKYGGKAHFHEDHPKDVLIKMTQQAGFSKVFAWEQFHPMDLIEEKDVDQFMQMHMITGKVHELCFEFQNLALKEIKEKTLEFQKLNQLPGIHIQIIMAVK